MPFDIYLTNRQEITFKNSLFRLNSLHFSSKYNSLLFGLNPDLTHNFFQYPFQRLFLWCILILEANAEALPWDKLWKSQLNHASLGLSRKENTGSISIYVSFSCYLVKHPSHHISVTLMENIRDALLMFHPSDILLFLSLSPSSSGPPRNAACGVTELPCIKASVTAHITAQRTNERPSFKSLSGRRTVTCCLRPGVTRCTCHQLTVPCHIEHPREWIWSNDLWRV